MTNTDQPSNNANDSNTATASQSSGEDAKHTPIIDARLADVTSRFGDRLDDAQRAIVRARIGRTVALADSLRKLPLTNADEPEIVFVPYRDPS